MSTSLFLVVLVAAVFHAVWNFYARKMSGNIVVFWFALWVSVLVLLPLVAGLVVLEGVDAIWAMYRQGYPYMIGTGIFHIGYFILLARAYEYGEISVVYPVARGSGIGATAFCGWLFLNEDINWIGATGIGLVCLGILSMGAGVLRQNEQAIDGFKSALGVGVTIIGYSVIDKMGVGVVNPILYIWTMFLVTVLAIWPLVISRHRGEVRKILARSRRSILIIGTGSAGTYLTILFAFTMGPVGYIVALREFAVVVGAVLGVVLLGEKLTAGKVVAIGTIAAGLVCIKLAS
ncbi:MAG: EamA family transporter [Candidatus Latescibacteria bacterium]|nr:EamA family transporter [Candidatus Latescibacterota bacterium]